MAYSREAITKANELRPNALPDEQKADWLMELDGKLAEMMQTAPPERRWPEDQLLLMPFPYDNIYTLYVAAMIDYYQQETDLYENDMTMFNQALTEAKAWYRRSHRPLPGGNWRVM